MCTSIAMRRDALYFGRNLDLECGFGERVVITPRNYPFTFRAAGSLPHHYAIIGMAAVAEGFPLYADAVNECGLCIAALNFPENACYAPKAQQGKTNISPFELIPWLLGSCAAAKEARVALEHASLIGIPFSAEIPLTPLHWHIADGEDSFVLEVTKDGMQIYDDPVGVLTNNPPFPFHRAHLSLYLHLTTGQPHNAFSDDGIRPFGKGQGSFGLPGDFSSASRFVKAAYLLQHSQSLGNDHVTQLFHLLGAVAVVNGSIAEQGNSPYFTIYTSCMDAKRGIYYYRTYGNAQICAVHLHHENLDAVSLAEFPLVREQRVLRLN